MLNFVSLCHFRIIFRTQSSRDCTLEKAKAFKIDYLKRSKTEAKHLFFLVKSAKTWHQIVASGTCLNHRIHQFYYILNAPCDFFVELSMVFRKGEVLINSPLFFALIETKGLVSAKSPGMWCGKTMSEVRKGIRWGSELVVGRSILKSPIKVYAFKIGYNGLKRAKSV